MPGPSFDDARPTGDPVSQRVLAEMVERVDVGQLATRLLSDFRGQIPGYSRLAHAEIGAEIVAVTRTNLGLALRWIGDGRPPSREELARLRASARSRAGEGMPLEDLLTAYRLGERVCWQALAGAAHGPQHDRLFDAADVLMRYVNLVSTSITRTYVDERSMVTSESELAARRLLVALCGSELPSAEELELVEQLRFPLRSEYAPFAAVLPDGAVVRHAELAAELRGAGALAVTEGSRVCGLATAPLPVERLRLGDELVLTQRDALPTAELSVVLDQLRMQVDIARRAGRRGLLAAHEFLPELLLGASPQLAEQIERRVFGPLEGLQHGELTMTLETFAACGFHRQRTARALPVHRNTLVYRLQRIEEVTGLELETARDQTLVWLAAAHRRERQR